MDEPSGRTAADVLRQRASERIAHLRVALRPDVLGTVSFGLAMWSLWINPLNEQPRSTSAGDHASRLLNAFVEALAVDLAVMMFAGMLLAVGSLFLGWRFGSSDGGGATLGCAGLLFVLFALTFGCFFSTRTARWITTAFFGSMVAGALLVDHAPYGNWLALLPFMLSLVSIRYATETLWGHDANPWMRVAATPLLLGVVVMLAAGQDELTSPFFQAGVALTVGSALVSTVKLVRSRAETASSVPAAARRLPPHLQQLYGQPNAGGAHDPRVSSRRAPAGNEHPNRGPRTG